MINLKRNWIILAFIFIVFISAGFAWLYPYAEELPRFSPYPFGKNFAFTITDDPDDHKLAKIRLVYDFLSEQGLKTTIAVWAREATRSNGIPDIEGEFDYGETLKRKAYRDYILELKKNRFEIALHTVSGGNDRRDETIKGYEDFKAIFKEYPKVNIMHSKNLDDIYWGTKVFKSRFARWVFGDLIGKVFAKGSFPFAGEDPNSSYFWGDILKERTKYVRLWGTSDINTLKFNPSMPYHDPDKPYVNYWFSFSDGYDLRFFNKLLSDKNIEKLVKERGASIVYTHFAAGFAKKTKDGSYKLDEIFKNQIKKLAQQRDGWFVPASVLLDRLLAMKNISLFNIEAAIIVVNSNAYPVDGVTLLLSQGVTLYDSHGNSYQANDEGEIIIDKIGPNNAVTLFKSKNLYTLKNTYPDRWEYLNLVLKRSLIWLFYHKD